MKLKIRYNVYGLFLLVVLTGCKKFVDVPPPVTSLISTSVYNNNATASAGIAGIYNSLLLGPTGGGIYTYGFSAMLGLSADEFEMYPNADETLNRLYTNSLSSNPGIPPYWGHIYNYIYQCNKAIETLNASTGVTASLKDQFIGTAKFARAFCYFYLVNIYGDVPLILGTDYKANSVVSRNTENAVYDQIEMDLKDAQSLLSDQYRSLDGSVTDQRTLPNKGAATALLSRVYLYRQKWADADNSATTAINNTMFQLSADINKVFLANNQEAIWQLEQPNNGFNAPDAIFLVGLMYYGGPNINYPFLLNNSLIAQFSSSDLRKQKLDNKQRG